LLRFFAFIPSLPFKFVKKKKKKKVSSKLDKLNILYFKRDDKTIEDFINSICGDSELKYTD